MRHARSAFFAFASTASKQPRGHARRARAVVPGLAAILLLLLLWFAPAAQGAALTFANKPVGLTAREQPLPEFLRDLFGQVDVPVVVSPAVKGSVNGNFSGAAEPVLNKVAAAFGLTFYFDGSVMHAYMANETLTRTMALPSAAAAEKIKRLVAEMNLADKRNYLRSTRDGVIMVTGTRRFLEQVEELYRADSARRDAAPGLSFKVFTLRYAWAQDTTVNFGNRELVVPGVASILRSLVTGGTGIPTPPHSVQRRPTQTKLKGQGLAKNGQSQPVLGMDENGQPGADTAANAYGAGGGQMPNDGLSAPSRMSAPEAMVRIQADTRLNAIIVRDMPERMADYEQLIRSLDIEPVSIEIEATIIDINTDRATELGINWRWTNGRQSTLFGNGTASDLRLQPGAPQNITPSIRGAAISTVLGDLSQFIARINLLETQGAARIVSSPQVVTLSNVEAIFDNSSTFYVKVAGREEVDLFNVSAGTSLRVTPHVFKDAEGNRIKLLVNLEDGVISNTRSVEQIPVVERSTVNTQALIYEGESLLIGGLTRESTEKASDSIPVIGDIPLLGRLFKTERKSAGRVERLFLIAPRLTTRRTAPASVNSRASTQAVLPPPLMPVPAPAPMQVPPPAPVVPSSPAVPAQPQSSSGTGSSAFVNSGTSAGNESRFVDPSERTPGSGSSFRPGLRGR